MRRLFMIQSSVGNTTPRKITVPQKISLELGFWFGLRQDSAREF